MAARAGAPSATRVSERFPIAEVGRWRALLDREHATLAPVLDCARDGADLLVWREAPPARRVIDGRIPRHLRAGLFLQAAAAGAFFAAHGGAFGLDLEDLRWDAAAGEGRLWLTRMPPAAGGAAAVPDSLVGALAELLGRLFAPGERGTLGRDLASAGAARRRPEFWVAGALRAFPELALPAAAGARERCLGLPGSRLRSLRARALSEKANALVAGKSPRLFEPGRSPVEPGGALGLSPPPRSAADASRRLRTEAARAARDTRPVWIAVAPERWDALSRLSFETARHALDDRVEIATVSELSAPDGPDAWRDAVWIPCGTVAGSVRFYEWLAEVAPVETSGCLARVRAILASPGWPGFAADATGDAPLPALAGDPRPAASKVRDAAGAGGGAGTRIESLLAAGRFEAALADAEAWIRDLPGADAVAWFSLSARLAAEAGDRFVPWLEALEAEREVAGGRPVEARERLDRVARHPASGPDDRRRASLRSAEVSVLIGESSAAARRAAAWRRAHPDAPAGESVRALRLGALGLAREGHADGALALLDEAERSGGDLAQAERLETALARAQVLALGGRFEEEASLYERMRPAALAAGDDRLAARFLAQEARGLLDRREYGRAIVRLEEAMAVAADDPAERAALGIDLGATLYHAGQPDRSEQALEGAIAAAAAAGREDLARIARGNRIELLLDRCAFDAAEPEVAALERSARREKDDRRLLVALHQRSRLALRRGDLEAAARDNAEARALAEAIGDRLEVGELWLEEGDRAAYAGDRDGARSAWERAAADPPDRCRTDGLARARLGELDGSSGTQGASAPDVEALFAAEPFRAAEAVARWTGLRGRDAVAATLRERAARVLRDAGATRLAGIVADPPAMRPSEEALRDLRRAVVAGLGGDGAAAGSALSALGLAALAVRDGDGREIVRLGERAAAIEAWRPLDAGSARFGLGFRPDVPEDVAAAVALLLETLLYRARPEESASDHAEGWRRLGVVTADAAMEDSYRRLKRFAPQPVTVLILGESGSGKEAAARAIHRLSPRSTGPFVPVNIAAIPAALLESELFGHARGAFTGADRDRRGLLEEAHGGTIFFDEVGDLAAPLQPKLLRALQEREIRRAGENRARPIDVRVVSATSRDLARDVEAGRFREDLYYRLHVALVRLPPLRERGRDCFLLARHFLDRFGREYGRGTLRLSPEAGAAIAAHPWPGNVRELQNAMAQAAALCEPDGIVSLGVLPDSLRQVRRAEGGAGDYRSRVDAHRRDLIADALDRTGGNRSRAARELGLSRQALLYLIRELKVPERGRAAGGARRTAD